MSCLHPIRTCFFLTCTCLDATDGKWGFSEWYDFFVQFRNFKIVYRRYAGLYFCFCVDVLDNNLYYLEAIHNFVEVRIIFPHPIITYTQLNELQTLKVYFQGANFLSIAAEAFSQTLKTGLPEIMFSYKTTMDCIHRASGHSCLKLCFCC